MTLTLDGNRRIKGVYSSATGEILQIALFEEVNTSVLTAQKKALKRYADIKFKYSPGSSAKEKAGTDLLGQEPTSSETQGVF